MITRGVDSKQIQDQAIRRGMQHDAHARRPHGARRRSPPSPRSCARPRRRPSRRSIRRRPEQRRARLPLQGSRRRQSRRVGDDRRRQPALRAHEAARRGHLPDRDRSRQGKSARARRRELLHRLQLPQLRRIPTSTSRCSRASSPRWSPPACRSCRRSPALTEQVERERFKNVIGARARVGERGHRRSPTRSGLFPHVFDELYCSMVRAGESSGALAPVPQRLAEYVENRMGLRNQLINAMIYPALMLVLQRRRRGRRCS